MQPSFLTRSRSDVLEQHLTFWLFGRNILRECIQCCLSDSINLSLACRQRVSFLWAVMISSLQEKGEQIRAFPVRYAIPHPFSQLCRGQLLREAAGDPRR